jgi:HEPN domain-containing protein
LQEAGQRFPKTHDLAALLSMALPLEPSWTRLHAGLAALTDAAVEFRYPNNWSSNTDAKEAFVTCRRMRAAARKSLGLK